VPPNASLLIRDVLANMKTNVLPQPHYSPDLAPADFLLFPKLKSTLKGRFQTIQEITENSQMCDHEKGVPGLFPEVATVLAAVHQCRRGVL
jgi:hypothetical protein